MRKSKHRQSDKIMFTTAEIQHSKTGFTLSNYVRSSSKVNKITNIPLTCGFHHNILYRIFMSLQQKATTKSKGDTIFISDQHVNKSVTKCEDIHVRCGTCPVLKTRQLYWLQEKTGNSDMSFIPKMYSLLLHVMGEMGTT